MTLTLPLLFFRGERRGREGKEGVREGKGVKREGGVRGGREGKGE